MQIKRATIQLNFIQPISLNSLKNHRNILSVKGVYFITHSINPPTIESFSPFQQDVIYIGKAINETIYTRCQKHLVTIRNEKTTNGNPKTYPGKKFKLYRETIEFKSDNHWVIGCSIIEAIGYNISFIEEFLLHHYQKNNNMLPPANTAGT